MQPCHQTRRCRPWLAALALLLAGCRTATPGLTSRDLRFLDDLEHRSWQYFAEQTSPVTGLTADRARADGSTHPAVASIAATGFGLTALCIADQRRWLPHDQAVTRARTALLWLRDRAQHEHGFLYHFVDRDTGRRVWNCELSSLDTALLLAGVLTVRQHFADPELDLAAEAVYRRVDWPWMLNGGPTLSMGWKPESGFLAARWSHYCELMILYLLGLGSPTHPLEPAAWQAWKREPLVAYAGRTFIQCPPLFTHQYSHAWVDFRGRRDGFADYWRNSVDATLAHRQFCVDQAPRFPAYGQGLWGVTASDSAHGYVAWGGPPETLPNHPLDGTVVPCAAAGSLPFAPRECLDALLTMRDRYGHRAWSRYGFVDAFNPNTDWTGPDVIGIDVGISLLMAENLRTGFVWQTFMRNPEIREALRTAGFRDSPN